MTHHVSAYFPALEAWIRTGNVDVVQARHSIFRRDVEERVLPAAADQDVAFFAHLTMEKDRLHRAVGNLRLPRFRRPRPGVRELGAVLPQVRHVAPGRDVRARGDPRSGPPEVNLGALRGPLPDAELRAEMVRHVERGARGFGAIDETPWYPDKEFDGRVRLSGSEHVFH